MRVRALCKRCRRFLNATPVARSLGTLTPVQTGAAPRRDAQQQRLKAWWSGISGIQNLPPVSYNHIISITNHHPHQGNILPIGINLFGIIWGSGEGGQNLQRLSEISITVSWIWVEYMRYEGSKIVMVVDSTQGWVWLGPISKCNLNRNLLRRPSSQKRTLQIGDFGKQQQWEMALGVMRRMRQEFLRRHSNQTLPFGFG
jgi:hypothetical protein